MATARERWQQLLDATQERFAAEAEERATRGNARLEAVRPSLACRAREDAATQQFEDALRSVELATSSARR